MHRVDTALPSLMNQPVRNSFSWRPRCQRRQEALNLLLTHIYMCVRVCVPARAPDVCYKEIWKGVEYARFLFFSLSRGFLSLESRTLRHSWEDSLQIELYRWSLYAYKKRFNFFFHSKNAAGNFARSIVDF